MECIESKYSSDSEIFCVSISSIRIPLDRKVFEKIVHNPVQAPYANNPSWPITDNIEIALQIMVYFLGVFNFGFSGEIKYSSVESLNNFFLRFMFH